VEKLKELAGSIKDLGGNKGASNKRKCAHIVDDLNDSSLDDDHNIMIKPSCQDAITATSILQKYVADLDNSFTRKLEVILANFNCQTHLLRCIDT